MAVRPPLGILDPVSLKSRTDWKKWKAVHPYPDTVASSMGSKLPSRKWSLQAGCWNERRMFSHKAGVLPPQMSLLPIECCKTWLKKLWPLCDFNSEVEQDRLKTSWEIYPGMITSSGLKWTSSALNALSDSVCWDTIGNSVGLHGTLAAMNSISICKLGRAFSINFTGSKLPTGRPDFDILRVRPPSSYNVLAA